MIQATALPAELTLSDYLAIARKRVRWLLLPIVLLSALAAFMGLRQDPEYRSTAIVSLGDNAAQVALGQSSQNSSFLDRSISNEILAASGDVIEQRVDEQLGLVPDVSITASNDADAMLFTATASTADDAALFANTWARVFTELKQEQTVAATQAATDQFRQRLSELEVERTELLQPVFDAEDALARATDETRAAALQRDVDRLERQISPRLNLIDSETNAITSSITTLQLNGELASTGTASVVQVAAAPRETSNAPLWRTILLGLVAGSVLGVALALGVESMDKTIRTIEDLRTVSGHPVLGEVPLAKDLTSIAIAAANPGGSPVADGYHRVRSTLQFTMAGDERPIRSIMITSANQSEGKSTTASNLVWSLAALGSKVLLVDVDFHRPTAHNTYEVDRMPGLSGVVMDHAPLYEAATRFSGPAGEMALLPTGALPPAPADFLGSKPFEAALEAFMIEADLVVLDAPPVLPVADATALAEIADGVVLTAFAGKTKVPDLQRAIGQLEDAGGHILGIILVAAKESRLYRDYYEDNVRDLSTSPTEFIRSAMQLRVPDRNDTVDVEDEVEIDVRESTNGVHSPKSGNAASTTR